MNKSMMQVVKAEATENETSDFGILIWSSSAVYFGPPDS